MNWTIPIGFLIVAVSAAVAFSLWKRGAESAGTAPGQASSNSVVRLDPRPQAEEETGPDGSKTAGGRGDPASAIEGLLDLLYCDISPERLRDFPGESTRAILSHLEAGEKEAALEAAGAHLKLEKERGEARAILGAWHLYRELGGEPPAAEAGSILGLVVETNHEGLTAITGAFADGEARLYSLDGMGVIGEMTQYPKVASAARKCVAAAGKVAGAFHPASDRAHPEPEQARITLLTPEGFRVYESPVEALLEDDHELAGLFGEFMQLQSRLLRVYAGIEGKLEGALVDEDLAQLKDLLEKGEDPNGETKDGMPLLLRAVGQAEAVSALIEAGARLDVLVSNEEMGWTKFPLLGLVAEGNYAETVKLLLEAGATVDLAGPSGRTPLIHAVGRGAHDSAGVLLAQGADPDHKDVDARFPLLEATLNDDVKMIDLLVKHGANLDAKGADHELTALIVAAMQGETATVRALAAHGADLEARDGDTYSPLMSACNKGRTETVALLLELGARVNAKDKQGSTPVMFAAQHGNTEIIQALLDEGADINARGTHDFTALGLVMQHGHQETIKLLKANGAKE